MKRTKKGKVRLDLIRYLGHTSYTAFIRYKTHVNKMLTQAKNEKPKHKHT